jgi:hypothetical protein
MCGEPIDDDFIFYGIVCLPNPKLDYFKLSDLKKVKLPFGLKIVRDDSFEPIEKRELLITLMSS